MSICTGLKQQAGDGMGEKKERGRFTLRFNEGDPIHETAIGLLELQSPRTKAQYVANAVVYYNEHFGQEPQPLNASIISKEAVVAIVKEILRQEGTQPGCRARYVRTENSWYGHLQKCSGTGRLRL